MYGYIQSRNEETCPPHIISEDVKDTDERNENLQCTSGTQKESRPFSEDGRESERASLSQKVVISTALFAKDIYIYDILLLQNKGGYIYQMCDMTYGGYIHWGEDISTLQTLTEVYRKDDPMNGLFCGPIVYRSIQHTWTALESAITGLNHNGLLSSCHACTHKVYRVTPEMVAYDIYLALVPGNWKDCRAATKTLYDMVLNSFFGDDVDEVWVEETLALPAGSSLWARVPSRRSPHCQLRRQP
ncbi:hypothetical protein GGX14DRAFT_402504 [Mycena pura]|uniref:Uncharacterized protein n=1 Tax=Mycena pura TaxID=153505 RepID=A0AAD6V1W5_9AGAR|nr:hypothetical protein GGX14DRAFT_402504 [Mycena pura]